MAVVTYVYDGPQRIHDGSQVLQVSDANGVRRSVPINGIVELDDAIAASLEWLARLRPAVEPGIEGDPIRAEVEMAGTPSQDDVLAWEESLNAFTPKEFDRVQYMGTWDTFANNPHIQDGVGVTGQYFYVLYSNNIDLGSGIINFRVGDLVVYNDGIWEKVAGFSPNSYVQNGVDAATITPVISSRSVINIPALSQNTLIDNPADLAYDSQQIVFRIKTTVSRTLTWGTKYRGSTDSALPTTTTGSSKTDYVMFWYNASDDKYDLIRVNKGH